MHPLIHCFYQHIRENEPFAAGHTSEIFRGHYDLDAAKTTQMVITALQSKEGRDTVTLLEALGLPIQSSISEERMRNLALLKDEKERKNAEKKQVENAMDLSL